MANERENLEQRATCCICIVVGWFCHTPHRTVMSVVMSLLEDLCKAALVPCFFICDKLSNGLPSVCLPVLIDKDHSPHWAPASLEGVTTARCLEPLLIPALSEGEGSVIPARGRVHKLATVCYFCQISPLCRALQCLLLSPFVSSPGGNMAWFDRESSDLSTASGAAACAGSDAKL